MAQTDVVTLLESIAEQCRECPRPTLVRNYIDVCRDFCERTRWLTKTVTGIATAVDQVSYTITADTYNDLFGVFSIDLLESATKIRQLVEQASEFWDPDAASDIPERWEYVMTGQFKLDPPPAAAYDLVVEAFMRPKKTATSIDSRLADECDQAIEYGVLSRVKAIINMPWSDPRGADMNGRMYESNVGTYSALADRKHNAGSRGSVVGGAPNSRTRSRVLKI